MTKEELINDIRQLMEIEVKSKYANQPKEISAFLDGGIFTLRYVLNTVIPAVKIGLDKDD